MVVNPSALMLSEQDVAEIQLFCDVASANGTHLSLKEAISLLRPDASEQELLEAWGRTRGLSMRFEIQSGFILEKSEERWINQLEAYEEKRAQRAKRNLYYAARFARFYGDNEARVLSVSGSSSYGSVSAEDDLDFFCITQQDTMWFFLTRSLILARVFRLLRRESPSLCFSCVMDERFAQRKFNKARDALFARDALNAHVIHGSYFYNHLLRQNSWLSEYFPKLYRTRVEASTASPLLKYQQGPNIIMKAVNLCLYHTVGRYLRLKAEIGNRRLTKEGRLALLFTAMIGKDHCIFESVRYASLRKKYQQIQRLAAVT